MKMRMKMTMMRTSEYFGDLDFSLPLAKMSCPVDEVADVNRSSDDDSDDEDETAALMAELAKIKQERAEEKARLVSLPRVLCAKSHKTGPLKVMILHHAPSHRIASLARTIPDRHIGCREQRRLGRRPRSRNSNGKPIAQPPKRPRSIPQYPSFYYWVNCRQFFSKETVGR